MNRWKIAFFVAIVAGIASNVYWFMQFVDSAISYSYLGDSYDAQARRYKALGELVVAGSTQYSQADILHLLRQAYPDGFIVEEENKIFFKGIEFALVDNKLAEIR